MVPPPRPIEALHRDNLDGSAATPSGRVRRLVGQAARIASLRGFLEYALDKGGVWFARRIDIANWRLAHHEEFKP